MCGFSKCDSLLIRLRRFSVLALNPDGNRFQAESFVNVLVSFLRRPFAKCIPSLSVRFGLPRRHFPLVLKLAASAPSSSHGVYSSKMSL